MVGRGLQVILKLTEVCNIACTYCYYFFSGDERHATRPVRILDDTVSGLIRFLNEAQSDGRIDRAQIVFHGGEPLMIGKPRFDALCARLSASLGVPVELCLTTNAMLIDEGWIALFEQWDVHVCVSIDGPADVHDRDRIDKRGRGTHARVVAGYRRLQSAYAGGRIGAPGVLAVVQPSADPRRIYRYLIHDLGIRHIDFLMPDRTWDSAACDVTEMALHMAGLLECWLADDDPAIVVRTFNSVMGLLVSGRTQLAGFGSAQPTVMTVGSDGEIDTDDFLKPCGVDLIATRRTLVDASFADVFDAPFALDVRAALDRIPTDCGPCVFRGACRGGQATHRHSHARGFDNPSVYYDVQYALFERAARHLVETGVAPGVIESACVRP